MERKKLIIILIIALFITAIFILTKKPNEIKFSNSPCWYYTNQSANEIKLSGINSTEINIYSNNDQKLFVRNKNTKEEIPECMEQ